MEAKENTVCGRMHMCMRAREGQQQGEKAMGRGVLEGWGGEGSL